MGRIPPASLAVWGTRLRPSSDILLSARSCNCVELGVTKGKLPQKTVAKANVSQKRVSQKRVPQKPVPKKSTRGGGSHVLAWIHRTQRDSKVVYWLLWHRLCDRALFVDKRRLIRAPWSWQWLLFLTEIVDSPNADRDRSAR